VRRGGGKKEEKRVRVQGIGKERQEQVKEREEKIKESQYNRWYEMIKTQGILRCLKRG